MAYHFFSTRRNASKLFNRKIHHDHSAKFVCFRVLHAVSAVGSHRVVRVGLARHDAHVKVMFGTPSLSRALTQRAEVDVVGVLAALLVALYAEEATRLLPLATHLGLRRTREAVLETRAAVFIRLKRVPLDEVSHAVLRATTMHDLLRRVVRIRHVSPRDVSEVLATL